MNLQPKNLLFIAPAFDLELQKKLHKAVVDGNVKAIRNYVKMGADVNSPDEDGWTPVLIAAQYGHVHVIRALAEHGADLNTPNNDGTTPVYIAAQEGHVEVIKVLVKHGADMNTPKDDGGTPVLAAAHRGHADVIKLLYKLGADMKLDSTQFSMKQLAQDENNTKALQRINKILNKLNSNCELCGSSSKRLKVCSKCEKVRYCSRECQVQDYKKHKKECHAKTEEVVTKLANIQAGGDCSLLFDRCRSVIYIT
jgi:ankyrin repeat protein